MSDAVRRSGRAGRHQRILIGLDEKITYGPDGLVNGPPGKEAVLVMEVSNPAKPRIRASLPLMNSLLGPPTNLQITPDGRLGLVANSVTNVQDGAAWKTVPDDKLFVIDLAASPPKLIDTLTVGKRPSGLSISRKGDLALVANRVGKSISVLSIQGGMVKAVGEVPMEQDVAAVVITPDGKRAFVCVPLMNKVGVLSIDGTNITYDKALDIPVAFNPFNIDVTPDGPDRFIGETGIDAPNGKWAVAPLLDGTDAKPTDWNHTKGGHAALMSIDASGMLTVLDKAPLGALPEGVAFSPDSQYVYIGNYIDKTLQVFRIAGNRLAPVETMPLPGQPA